MNNTIRSLDFKGKPSNGSATGGIFAAATALLSAPLWAWRQVPFYRWGWRWQIQAAFSAA